MTRQVGSEQGRSGTLWEEGRRTWPPATLFRRAWRPWPPASSRSSSQAGAGDWPGGPRTLPPRESIREPSGTLWFGAELDPDRDHEQVWFRIAEEAIGRMPEKPPADRGWRLVDALIVWITPDCPLHPMPPAGDRPPPRRGLHQPEHPPGVLGRSAPPRRLARRPGARGRAARFRARLAGEQSPAGESTARVLAGYRRTAVGRGRGQARPFVAADLAAVPLATCHRPRRRGRGAAAAASSPTTSPRSAAASTR